MLPCNWRKVRRLSAGAVSYRVKPRAEEKKSPFDFPAKKKRNVGISILQGQQSKASMPILIYLIPSVANGRLASFTDSLSGI
jgi:hypothetical protein